jgi:hypothetical protein
MKTPILKLLSGVVMTLLGILICGIIVLLASCETPKRTTTDIPVLVDVTEPLLAWPDAKEIVKFYEFDTDEMQGASFRLTIVSDVSINRQIVFSLPAAGKSFETNRYTRKREVAQFETDVTGSITALTSDTIIGRDRSSVFIPIARELVRLSQSTAERRALIIYSDLMENTADITFYDRKTLALMRTHPETIRAQLITKASLADLTGVEVHIVYQPKDAAADDTFRIVSGFYKTMLEEKGATVSIGANLTH